MINSRPQRRVEIEEGLIPVFRLFLWIRLGLLALTLCLWFVNPEQRTQRLPFLGLLEVSSLLIYLSWGRLEAAMGRAYLPLALVIASAGPIFENALVILIRVANNLPESSYNEDRWVLILALFIPLLVIAWQYRTRVLLTFCGLTALLETGLAILVRALGGPALGDVIVLIVVRSLIFLLMGLVVLRLMRGQRDQRVALAETNARLEAANREIAAFATTMEQLAISQERNRMAREMHDTLAHSLSAVAVQVEAVRSLWEQDAEAAHEMLDRALNTTRTGLNEARRAIHDLRSSPLEDLGLARAIEARAESVAERTGLTLEMDLSLREGLPLSMEQGVYRIADEVFSNISRHAHGATRLEVILCQENGHLDLLIADDGPGFDPAATLSGGHYGLKGLHERAAMMGGILNVEAEPGSGTRVTLRLGLEGIDG